MTKSHIATEVLQIASVRFDPNNPNFDAAVTRRLATLILDRLTPYRYPDEPFDYFTSLDADLVYAGSIEDKLIAGGWARIKHSNGASKLRLEQIAVEKIYEGLGFGRTLLGTFEEAARELGCGSITLTSSESAIGFYEQCGYGAGKSKYDRFKQVI
jgi:GNAT superfamily N-acetyltransferase